jgi:23S rRNA (guanosine2251-2'-O)-methyltransferase
VTPDLVYGRRSVREALRGRREVLELWATERALLAEPWLGEAGAKLKLERELTERAGTRDHQGVLALAEPYRYADGHELARTERPLLAVLDRVTDPRNLGAVCRSADGAGATGVVVPAHGSAVVTPAVARASAGAVEHLPVARVRNLADFLADAKEAGCWVYGAAAGARTSYDAPDYSGGVVLVLGGEGKGLRPRVASACDDLISLPIRGRIASLNVSAAAAVVLYTILQNRLDTCT